MPRDRIPRELSLIIVIYPWNNSHDRLERKKVWNGLAQKWRTIRTIGASLYTITILFGGGGGEEKENSVRNSRTVSRNNKNGEKSALSSARKWPRNTRYTTHASDTIPAGIVACTPAADASKTIHVDNVKGAVCNQHGVP